VSASGLVSELELVAFAREFLVSVKAPKRIFVLKTLPKGPANKVRRFEVAAHCQALAGARRRSTRETRASWTPLEQDIARIWKELLRIDVVEPDDDFFLLGGDSLKAAEFLARLHRRYRVSLGLGAMFEDEATVSGMARVVERARSDTSHASMAAKNLVPIKASGTRTPLFVVPAKAGTPIGFVHLARLLDAQQPVIGIEFRGMNGLDRPLARMEDIAADNVARIRMIQPQGPYLLMGNCFGGCVTYEMARQLEAAGEIVRLFMLDAPSPFSDGEGRRRGSPVRGTPGWKLLTQYALGRMRKHVTSLMELQGSERTAFLREKMAATLAIVRTRDVFRGDRRRFGRRAVYAANRQASRNYVPGPFAGPVVLYLTRDRETESQRSRRLDWLSLAPQIGAPSYIGGRGSGRSMLTPPYVYELASAVNRELEAARADAGSRGPKRAPLVRVEKAPFVREPTRRPS
jgi:thioesterase domain-containing protein/acyl carrier protein